METDGLGIYPGDTMSTVRFYISQQAENGTDHQGHHHAQCAGFRRESRYPVPDPIEPYQACQESQDG